MWEPMRLLDVERVCELGDLIYTANYHEPIDAVLTRFRAGPCFSWWDDGEIVGYVVTHPWDDTVPVLGASLEPVANPTLQFIHDVAIHPSYRGHGMVKGIMAHIKSRFDRIALVSVGETRAFWEHRGFVATDRDVTGIYFAGSCYMVWERPGVTGWRNERWPF